MKYMIEIEDEPFVRKSALYGEKSMYRAKGFKSLVFDKFGLDKLTPLDKELEEAYQKGYDTGSHESTTLEYQRGLDDAWETAKYLFSEMSNTEINLVFPHEWNNGGFKALMALHPQDAINRIKAYEEQQKADEIKVGDEVIPIDAIRRPFVVVSIENNVINGFDLTDGYTPRGCHRDETHWEKTGRHFPHVEELVKAMKGGAE